MKSNRIWSKTLTFLSFRDFISSIALKEVELDPAEMRKIAKNKRKQAEENAEGTSMKKMMSGVILFKIRVYFALIETKIVCRPTSSQILIS